MSISSSSSSSGSGRYVSLTIGQIKQYVEGRTQGYSVSLTVTEAHNMTEDIFVFQRRDPTVAGNHPVDEFHNVATSNDIDIYAADAPAAGQAYYRLAVVELVLRSIENLEQSVLDIENDIAELIRTLNQLDTLVDETVTLG